MALTNPGFKTKIGLMFGRELKNVKEKEKRRGRRRREVQAKIKQKGMETTLSMDFVGIIWNFKALYG